MSLVDTKIEQMLHKVDLIKQVHGPKNVVLVTTEDIIEIIHELVPYSMRKWEQAEEILSSPADDTAGKGEADQ